MGWEAKAAYMESRAKQRLQDAAAVRSFLLYFFLIILILFLSLHIHSLFLFLSFREIMLLTNVLVLVGSSLK